MKLKEEFRKRRDWYGNIFKGKDGLHRYVMMKFIKALCGVDKRIILKGSFSIASLTLSNALLCFFEVIMHGKLILSQKFLISLSQVATAK